MKKPLRICADPTRSWTEATDTRCRSPRSEACLREPAKRCLKNAEAISHQMRPWRCRRTCSVAGRPCPGRGHCSHWDEAHKVAGNREYVTYTGIYKGAPISCMSTGIGCPSTAIGMEELARCGARTFLRVGTCGTFQDRVKVGDLAIFDSAIREDGASKAYAPIEFPAVASIDVVNACVQAAEEFGFPAHVGRPARQTRSTRRIPYPDPPTMAIGRLIGNIALKTCSE